MRNLLIDGRENQKVPLRMVADVEVENRPYFINRERVQRRILVQAKVQGRTWAASSGSPRGTASSSAGSSRRRS